MKTILSILLAILLSTTATATQPIFEATEAMGQQVSSEVVGVGIVIEEIDSSFMVRDVVPGGPAQKDGRLMHGDFIVAVNKSLLPGDGYIPTNGMSLKEVVDMIRGQEGTRVGLLVERNNQTISIVLKREKLEF